jgi:rfaE bifunctional protein kinase chain/domain/rfaE bifunctional protein nucleotidyltransferase chain/domain
VTQSSSSYTLKSSRSPRLQPLKGVNHVAGEKIVSLDKLVEIIAKLKNTGKRIVLCHGVYDLVHLGHIRHLNLAKQEGDILVVTVTADKFVRKGPGRPIFNEHLRAETLASLAVTDYVAIVHSPLAVECIKKLSPDVYAKGPDYKHEDKDITGGILLEKNAIESVGGKLVITEDITFSSSNLINNYFDVYPAETIEYLDKLKRSYSIEKIIAAIHTLKSLKTLVIGDAIIDQYHYCLPMGKSSKEPLVVNRYISEETFAGGVLATANNIAEVCGDIDLVTVLGEKESFEEFIRNHLAPSITPTFFYRKDAQTIVKRRYVSHGVSRKLFEICFMDDTSVPAKTEKEILRHLEEVLPQYDLVVVNDYGHGFLSVPIIDKICSLAKYVALNVQTNSANIGFNLVTKYPRATCVCIDEAELRFATHDKYGDLRTHLKQVYEKLYCKQMIATRGAMGSLCYSESEGYCESPAFSYRVVDAVGAGDAFFAYIAPCFASGMSQELVSFIGNAVGSLAVQIVCNREPVGLVDLIKFITRLLK